MSTSFLPKFRKGDTVVFTGQTVEQRRWGGNSDANEVLTEGSSYTIEKVEVHSWHTKLHLQNITGGFNSACFSLPRIVTSL